MSDQTYKQDIEQGGLGSARGVTDALAVIRQNRTRIYTFKKLIAAAGTVLLDAMAADVTAEQFGGRIMFPGIVTKITLTPQAAILGDAANAFTLTVSKRDALGGAPTTLGTISSLNAGAGSFVAFLGKDLTLTNANLIVVAGGSLTWSIAKNGAGVVVPVFEVAVHILDQ